MIREFSAGGVVIRRMRGRPFVAVVRVRDEILALPKGHPFTYSSGRVADHDDEVEAAEWIPLEEAPQRLAYAGEREIAASALSTLGRGR